MTSVEKDGSQDWILLIAAKQQLEKAIAYVEHVMDHQEEDLLFPDGDGECSDHLVEDSKYVYDERCDKCRLAKLLEAVKTALHAGDQV